MIDNFNGIVTFMYRILIADDDVELTDLLTEYLQREGLSTETANDGETALNKARDGNYDMVILDIMMPKMNGFDVLRQLRMHSQVPVLMLTARGDDVDSIVGLEIGADDYLSKPCNPRVLMAHMRAILRRSDTPASTDSESIKIADLELIRGSRRVLLNDHTLSMTSTEFSILEVLMDNAGNVVSKEQLSERALGKKLSPYDRSLDMHISNLRKKLVTDPEQSDRIITVRGVGYQYVVPKHE